MTLLEEGLELLTQGVVLGSRGFTVGLENWENSITKGLIQEGGQPPGFVCFYLGRSIGSCRTEL